MWLGWGFCAGGLAAGGSRDFGSRNDGVGEGLGGIWPGVDFCGSDEGENRGVADVHLFGGESWEFGRSSCVVIVDDFDGCWGFGFGETGDGKGGVEVSSFFEVRDLVARVGDFEVGPLHFEVARGEALALVGPSGSGKTTLLEVVCGLREGQLVRGEILLGGESLVGMNLEAREIGLVPQDVVLFPSMTVREHLEFGLRVRKRLGKKERREVEGLGERLGLGELMERKVKGLSGGEGRRVSIGRALAFGPRLLCLDEALTGLDEARKLGVMEVLREFLRGGGAALVVEHGETGFREVEIG